MRRLLLTIVAVTTPPAALCAQTPTSSDAVLVQQIVREIGEVKGGITPAEWVQTHGEERLQMFNGPQYANDTQQWCARTVVAHPASTGRAWTRSVYFYDPQPPADDAPPAPGASARQVLETSCQLGLMWIDIPEGNLAVGTKLSEDIQAALASQYGSGLTTPRFGLGGFGSARWTATRQWSVTSARLTVAYDQFEGKPHRTLVRLAFANSDAVHDLIKETRHTHADLVAEIDELVRKAKEAGMPAAATVEMTDLLEKPDYFSGRNRPSDTQVVAAIRDWLTVAEAGSADQRAVALLAADRVLGFLGPGVPAGEAARAEMKSLGVDYVHDELAGVDVYTHGLLKKAKAVAPPGPSADEVLLFQMERGFDETGMCSGGVEEFSQVIQQGESLLAGGRALPSSTLSSLHFMVDDAYGTIVWLAKTTASEYHDSKKYQQMAESARAKALEHYRAAFNLEHGTARAQKAWKEAWRLAAGLPPTYGRYFCVYD